MTKKEFILLLEKENIKIDDHQFSQLEKYFELLVDYNKKVNLTAITNKEEVFLKHFFDSLTVTKVVDFNQKQKICDVGTGAGFPGLVLKILYPETELTLVDSLNKRIKFLDLVISSLKLKNVYTIHSRAEDYGKNNKEKFDVVTARAVTQLPKLLELCVPIVKVGGVFISMKADAEEEIRSSKRAMSELKVSLEKKEVFSLPKENSSRTILMFRKNEKTKKEFPRSPSEIKKQPLH